MLSSTSAALFTKQYPCGSQAFNDLVNKNVALALAEDIGGADTDGDLTVQLIPANQQANATIISRDNAIICGQDWVNACFKSLDANTKITWHVNDGDKVKPNQLLCEVTGNARALLSAERTALNFLQTLSAVATQTHEYMDAINGTKEIGRAHV